jgi:hypothetical protein
MGEPVGRAAIRERGELEHFCRCKSSFECLPCSSERVALRWMKGDL